MKTTGGAAYLPLQADIKGILCDSKISYSLPTTYCSQHSRG